MDYSNESFERFQQAISEAHGNDSLLWRLRDALFAEAFYGKANRLRKLFRFPGGWLLVLLALYLRERRGSYAAYPNSPPDACHYLFPSPRNNHMRRLLPMLESETGAGEACVAWYGVPGIPELAPESLRDSFHSVAGAWTRHIRFPDFQEASRLTRELEAILPEDLDAPKLAAIRVYLVQFLAWRRFWLERLGSRPSKIISTFEKAPRVKAFFHAAWELGVPVRIHWVHGLRHASIQSTLATELWCMTPGDVRFFKDRVPVFCTPSVRKNPEAAELSAAIGVLDPASLRQGDPIHFLFLGPGLEASYTKEMRMADLAVIRKIQREFSDRIAWRFRPHPSAIERFRDELTHAGIDIQDFSTRHLHEDLKWSHAAGSAWSSLLLDISETGRPIFWVQAEIRSLGAVDELIADGIGTHLDLLSASEKLTALWHPGNDNPK
jgi:hypothetical protein